MLLKIKNKLLFLLSYVWPYPIYIGKSFTIKDNSLFLLNSIRDKVNKRLNKSTIKYRMVNEFNIYELDNTNINHSTEQVIYRLKHCATGHSLEIDKRLFDIIFERV